MNRLLDPRRESEAVEPPDDVTPSPDQNRSGGGLRRVLFGLGVAALTYLVARRIRRSESAPSMGELKETVGDVRSGDGFEIPIGETGDDRSAGSEASWGTGTTQGAIGTEPMPGEDLSSGRSGDEDAPESEGPDRGQSDRDESGGDEPEPDRSGEAVEERAQDEPNGPGETTVDEDATDDVHADADEETDGVEDAGAEDEDRGAEDGEPDSIDVDDEGDA